MQEDDNIKEFYFAIGEEPNVKYFGFNDECDISVLLEDQYYLNLLGFKEQYPNTYSKMMNLSMEKQLNSLQFNQKKANIYEEYISSITVS